MSERKKYESALLPEVAEAKRNAQEALDAAGIEGSVGAVNAALAKVAIGVAPKDVEAAKAAVPDADVYSTGDIRHR